MKLRSSRGSPFEWLSGSVQGWSGSSTALRLAASALEDGTVDGYARHWATFAEWCTANELQPMPATPLMIFAYVGHLAERGTIAAGSLQPYLSAINRYHADAGHERPALGHFITAARQGMARAQALVETRDTRVPLLAEHVVRVLLEALRASSTLAARLGKRGAAEYLRRRYSFVLTFIFMGRQDSSVHLHECDHGIDGDAIWLRLTEKMRRSSALRRIIRLPLRPVVAGGTASLLPQVAELGRAYLAARAALGGKQLPFLFQLPGEPSPVTRHMNAWVQTTLAEAGISAPLGFAYLGHSLRSGGSSAAEAILVPRFRGNWLGGWSQSGRTRELHYLDPSVLPTTSAFQLFGWLLQGVYEAGTPGWERRARQGNASDEPGEPQGEARARD